MRRFALLHAAAAAILLSAIPVASFAQVAVGVGITVAPPPIPTYVQPPAPEANDIWTPGYWAWGPGGYYWVPGTWVQAPSVGLLWTPGYWGWGSNAYFWHAGYWGNTVGFYGGVNYGFGYFGSGYVGGRWYGNNFRYNTAVTNVNRTVIHNTYVDRTVINRNVNRGHTSYNGGNGGIHSRPTSGEITGRARGRAPTTVQQRHELTSSQDRNHLASVNHGQPRTAAVQRPYSATNRPSNFTPITRADRQSAQRQVARPQAQSRSGSRRPPERN